MFGPMQDTEEKKQVTATAAANNRSKS